MRKCAFSQCSPIVGNGGAIYTAAEVRLVFNSSVPPAQLPIPEEVVDILVDAVTNPNITLNVSIVPDSIVVLGE